MVVPGLLSIENQAGTKHVETLLVPRLDEGSNPSSSTKRQVAKIQPLVFLCFLNAIIALHNTGNDALMWSEVAPKSWTG